MEFSLKKSLAILASIAIAFVAAKIFAALNLPLPWMLGPLLSMAIASVSGVQLFDEPLGVPTKSRNIFVPIVGLMIGARVSPGFLSEVLVWWPSLLLVVPYMIAVQFLNAMLFRIIGKYDRATAFFAASPGGLVEAVLIGEHHGGQASLMAIQHFARVTLAVSVIPFLLSFELGAPVGSAAGVALDPLHKMLSLTDAALLGVAGVAGVYLAGRLKLPAGIMVGPFLFSAVFHASGITDAQIPASLLQAAQLVIGITLGMRFAGPSKTALVRGLGLSVMALTTTLILALGAALLVSSLGMAPTMVSFIAFAPGGLVEMGLIAISLEADPVFVAAHHVLRIGLAVTIAPWLFTRFYNR
jgi:membrane AbrB-like protein